MACTSYVAALLDTLSQATPRSAAVVVGGIVCCRNTMLLPRRAGLAGEVLPARLVIDIWLACAHTSNAQHCRPIKWGGGKNGFISSWQVSAIMAGIVHVYTCHTTGLFAGLL